MKNHTRVDDSQYAAPLATAAKNEVVPTKKTSIYSAIREIRER